MHQTISSGERQELNWQPSPTNHHAAETANHCTAGRDYGKGAKQCFGLLGERWPIFLLYVKQTGSPLTHREESQRTSTPCSRTCKFYYFYFRFHVVSDIYVGLCSKLHMRIFIWIHWTNGKYNHSKQVKCINLHGKILHKESLSWS